jgi:hypothetical protein
MLGKYLKLQLPFREKNLSDFSRSPVRAEALSENGI